MTVVESIKPKQLKLCDVEGCNKSKVKRGYCVKHYERWRRHGDPLKVKYLVNMKCSIDGCDGKHSCRGYCSFHYDRLRHKTPLTQEKRIIDPKRGCVILNCTRPHWGKYYCKIHYMRFLKIRKSRSKEDPKLEFIMNLIRKRDKNMCQWFGCSKTTNIHVHHIFPQSEYPELKYLEKYMICYCKKHHKEWHKKRGDGCYTLL